MTYVRSHKWADLRVQSSPLCIGTSLRAEVEKQHSLHIRVPPTCMLTTLVRLGGKIYTA